jgi:hypothetical protein
MDDMRILGCSTTSLLLIRSRRVSAKSFQRATEKSPVNNLHDRSLRAVTSESALWFFFLPGLFTFFCLVIDESLLPIWPKYIFTIQHSMSMQFPVSMLILYSTTPATSHSSSRDRVVPTEAIVDSSIIAGIPGLRYCPLMFRIFLLHRLPTLVTLPPCHPCAAPLHAQPPIFMQPLIKPCCLQKVRCHTLILHV